MLDGIGSPPNAIVCKKGKLSIWESCNVDQREGVAHIYEALESFKTTSRNCVISF